MLCSWTLLLIGLVAGVVELQVTESERTTAPDDTSAESVTSVINEISTHSSSLSPGSSSLLPRQVSNSLPSWSPSESSPDAGSSIQTTYTISTSLGAESSTSDAPMLRGTSTTWSSSSTNTAAIRSTSQLVQSTTTTKPSTTFESSTATKSSTIFESSTATKPSTIFESSTATKPSTIFESSTATKSSTIFESSTATKSSTIFESSTATKSSTIFESSTATKSSTISESSTTSIPPTIFESLSTSEPASTSAAPPLSGNFSPIVIIIVILIITVTLVVLIVLCMVRRKRSHSQTFAPMSKKKGKLQDSWAGPVALPEDGGPAEGAEEKKEEDLASKRMSLPLSTFFGKRKSRVNSVLLEEVNLDVQDPLLSTQPNGTAIGTQSSGKTQDASTEPSNGDSTVQKPTEQEPNGLVPEPNNQPDTVEIWPNDIPPPPPSDDTVLSIPEAENHEGQIPDSFSVKTSL
ncbi:leukosialin-like [Scyliorhinus canicula]|uniref:leukosialin-like n=1 Tax=Scyliorhinus canicula TaxID=7830 RepID=UPI0018F4F334|nr:leukosialin-like [Scyliorhinus canicula]